MLVNSSSSVLFLSEWGKARSPQRFQLPACAHSGTSLFTHLQCETESFNAEFSCLSRGRRAMHDTTENLARLSRPFAIARRTPSVLNFLTEVGSYEDKVRAGDLAKPHGGMLPTSPDTTASSHTRELAAIMFSDVVGYTAIMGRDENEALRALDAHRELLRSFLPKYDGRMGGEIGDGTLTSFHSAFDAMNCARELQASLHQPELKVRIGIHLGDVVFSNNTILGDGVNIASRIHALAPPGGICVSANVYDEIRNKPGSHFRDLGQQRFKNVSRPIRVYQIVGDALDTMPVKGRARRRRAELIAGASALILTGLIVVTMRSRSPAPASLPAPSVAKHTINSIAVLPLDDFSGDPNQEYFADGLTDELTTDLATISALRVISRGSVMQFRGEHRPSTPEIARMLDVDAVIEGSVARSGDKVRVTAQLIDAPADKHLWARSYERDSRDVLAMQDEIAQAIAREVNVELTSAEQAHFANSRKVNPAAHDAYLKGRYIMESDTEERVQKAIEQFEEAIKIDPNFALPYTGLADAYSYGADWFFPAVEVMPKAKAASEKALQLDDSLAEAHTSLALIKYQFDFDWTGSEREFRRAIELNPNYAFGHDQYGYLLAWQGRFDESLAEFQRASELDPLSPGITTDVGAPLVFQAKYEAAKERGRKALELDPGFNFAQWGLGWTDLHAGNFKEAIPELEKARVIDSPPFIAGFLGYAYAKAGDHAKAEAIIAELKRKSSRRFVSPACIALVYLGLGEKQRALEGLEKAYEVRSQWMSLLKVDTIFDPLRSEPRFIELLKKVGLDK
jgi:adenylate cyclase